MKKGSGSRIRTTSFPSVSVLSVLSVVKTCLRLAGLAVAFLHMKELPTAAFFEGRLRRLGCGRSPISALCGEIPLLVSPNGNGGEIAPVAVLRSP